MQLARQGFSLTVLQNNCHGSRDERHDSVHERSKNTVIEKSDTRLFAIGGWSDNNTTLASVEVYCVSTNTWSKAASLQRARYGHCSVTAEGQIFVLGGTLDDEEVTASVEVYEPTSNEWREGTLLPVPVTEFGACATGHQIFIFGGNDNNGNATANTFIYNTEEGEWCEAPSMPVAMYDVRVCLCAGRIYVSGVPCTTDTDSEGVMFFYDTANHSWGTTAPMKEARKRHDVFAAGGFVFAVGGESGRSSLATAERYNIDENEWEEVGYMNEARDGLRTTPLTIEDEGYMFGKGPLLRWNRDKKVRVI